MYNYPVKIFTQSSTPRLRYIAGIILGDILGFQWEIVTGNLISDNHPVINYSSGIIPGSFRIVPDSLLFETGTRSREIKVSEWKNLPVFFPITTDSDIPFDIFAASFYLVSRYEEYLEFEPDLYGRFPASSSLAYKYRFLDIPLVDLWAKELANELILKYPELTFIKNNYKALLTIDTDQPFAFSGRNILRTLGGFMHDITAGTGNTYNRYRVLAKKAKDPYDVYDYIADKIKETNTDARFFFSVGNRSKYDRNPSWKNNEYRELIKTLGDKFTAGLHPSYFASDNHSVLVSEIERLKIILGKDIILSRFHFIRLKMPVSYLLLLKLGITEDYSMGYPDEPGFRAGIARPFMFYDLSEEKQTGLKIVPFQVMDATLYQYRRLDPRASGEIIRNLIDKTRSAGGFFVSLWHNTSLAGSPEWEDWRKLFENMLIIQQE